MPDSPGREGLKLYLDDDEAPFKVAPAPLIFQFNTIALPDGPHRLRIEASNGLAPPTIRDIPFVVRNGVAITVSGLDTEQTVAGQVQMVINAYAGNTEVDFEPGRVETPQPVPTWAWVLSLAVVAWTLFYIVSPRVGAPLTRGATLPQARVGERLFMDACARCHGEDGRGQVPRVPALVDADIALAETPAPLLMRVATSGSDTMMPAWGTRLTNEELFAVVNHVRGAWGHDGNRIQIRHPKPPKGIDRLQREFVLALKARDADALIACCLPIGGLAPQLFRKDGVDARGSFEVGRVWRQYMRELEDAGTRITRLSFPDDRYDFNPRTVDQDGSVVIGAGRVFLETKDVGGRRARAKGRFLHVYERHGGRWTLVFDFADIPMAVGCPPGAAARIRQAPASADDPGETRVPSPRAAQGAPGARAAPKPRAGPPPTAVSRLGFAEVAALLAALEKDARSAPHENFWSLDYEDFVAFEFPERWASPERRIRLLQPYDAEASNLIRALRGEGGIRIRLPDGSTTSRADLGRMPKGAPAMPLTSIRAIERWIDAGCPEFPGRPSALPRPTARRAVKPKGSSPPFPAVPVVRAPEESPTLPAAFPPPTSGSEGQTPAPVPLPPLPATASGDVPSGDDRPPPPRARPGVPGFREVQEILGQVRGGGPAKIHDMAYAPLLALRLPVPGVDATFRLLTPGESRTSNLVRLLGDGRGVDVIRQDGTRSRMDLRPYRGAAGPLSEDDVGRIAAWIDAGCPKETKAAPER